MLPNRKDFLKYS